MSHLVYILYGCCYNTCIVMGYNVVQGLIHTAYMSEIGTSMHNSQAYASFKSQTHRTILMK